MFLLRRTDDGDTGNEVLVHPTATVDIKGPAIAFHLKKLGLKPGATWEQITHAHGSLISDLTPSSGANHSNVGLANQLRAEVDEAYQALLRFRPGVAHHA